MKQRLIELIDEGKSRAFCDICEGRSDCETCENERIADHLLAEGVIVPPCKVGQTVYVPWVYRGTKGIAFFEVTHIIIDCKKSYVRTNFDTDDEGFGEEFNGGQFEFDDFGKTVFLTKEEAEKALEEREKQ